PAFRPTQDAPPFAVARTFPVAPTATQTEVDGQETPYRELLVPEPCPDQDDPLLVVARIVPLAPTAKHSEADGQETPFSCWVVPDDCPDQTSPDAAGAASKARPSTRALAASVAANRWRNNVHRTCCTTPCDLSIGSPRSEAPHANGRQSTSSGGTCPLRLGVGEPGRRGPAPEEGGLGDVPRLR